MVILSALKGKIVKQVEALSDDTEFIKDTLRDTSTLVVVGEKGLRRNPDLPLPENLDDAYQTLMDHSIYVKGFLHDAKLDDIIEWFEKFGKTLNGSVFATFEKKEEAESFLKSNEAATYEGKDIIRLYRQQYLERKKTEREDRDKLKATKKAIVDETRDAKVTARMVVDSLLELTGLPNSSNESKSEETEGIPESNKSDKQTEPSSTPTILSLKQWLSEKVGTHIPVAWIDIEPQLCKAVVRFKQPNSAEQAWNKLKEVFGDEPVVYETCELKGRVLSGDEEHNYWKIILAAQQNKAQKRRGKFQGGKPHNDKRRRT